VERQTAVLESQKEQERARRVQQEAMLITLEAKRAGEEEKQQILAEAKAELAAAQAARAEAEAAATRAKDGAAAEKAAILAEARSIMAQDQKQVRVGGPLQVPPAAAFPVLPVGRFLPFGPFLCHSHLLALAFPPSGWGLASDSGTIACLELLW
jgi:hypothetical protein